MNNWFKRFLTFISPASQAGHYRVAWYNFLLIVCSLPFSFSLQIAMGWQTIFPLEWLIGLHAVFLLLVVIKGENHKPKLPDLAVLGFCLAALVSSFFSAHFLVAFKAALVTIAYALVFYGSARILVFDWKHWEVIIRVFSVSFCFLLVYTLVHYFQIGVHRQTSYLMAAPFSPGHTILIAVGFPVFLISLHRVFNRINLFPELAFVLFFGCMAALSFSRFYWVMMSLVVFIYMLYHFRKARPYMLAGLILLTFAMADTYQHIARKRDIERTWDDPDDHNSVFVQIQSIFIMNKNDSNIERFNRWKVAWRIFQNHPVLGVGLNCFPEHYFGYFDKMELEQTNLSGNRMNVHMVYLGWLSEVGVVGFTSGIVFIVLLIGAVYRLRRSSYFLLTAFLLGNYLLLGFIEDFTQLEKVIPGFWLAGAGILFLYNSEKGKADSKITEQKT